MADKEIKYSMEFPIDYSTQESFVNSAKTRIVGETIREIAKKYIANEKKAEQLISALNNKGNIGNIVEESLGIESNSRQEPDVARLGLEIKATPIEIDNGQIRAGERLVITMISYQPKDNEINGRNKEFEETHLKEKMNNMMLCTYIRPINHKGIDKSTYKINNISLIAIPEEDILQIRKDWETIMDYVYNGKADLLSESLTSYLGACTKGSKGKTKTQGYNPFTVAKPRAFCLKKSYMTYLYQNHIFNKNQGESSSFGNTTFENSAKKQLDKYIGMLDSEIAASLELSFNRKAKQAHSRLSLAMLGLKSNSCKELKASNTVIKTVRFESDWKLKESLSLPPSDFLSVIEEESFEESALYNYFNETRFLMSIWQKEKNKDEQCRFIGCFFWGMDGQDINGPLKNCWEKTKKLLMQGVELTPTTKGDKCIVKNNLPSSSETLSIAHVRPHAQKSFHIINDREYKNSDEASIKQAFKMPNGDWMPIQSFWLNSSYVKEIISYNLPSIRIKKQSR